MIILGIFTTGIVFSFNTNFYNDTCKYLIRRKAGFLGSKVYIRRFYVQSDFEFNL